MDKIIENPDYQSRLLRVIPGGAHTYSRGFDQFPSNAPKILSRGKGPYIYDEKGEQYLDFGMGLRSVGIGYAEERINRAAIEQINNGNTLPRPSLIELEASELVVSLIAGAEMVKFTKNGSCATTAAVKLARAYTGRKLIARCRQHPFHSFDDWFIGSTEMNFGIPEEVQAMTLLFDYNDMASLEKLENERPGQIACVILEPVTYEPPKNDYLKKLREFCTAKGIVLIFDEIITGFRWHLKGAQHLFDVQPDLSTFGKAMANGFPLNALCGRREIMQLGSTEFPGQRRLFLLSSTHGSDMASFGAFVETVKFMQEHKVVEALWQNGEVFTGIFQRKINQYGLSQNIKVYGYPCSPYYATLNEKGEPDLALRTLFLQEMARQKVIMSWVSICFRHGPEQMVQFEEALDKALPVVKKGLETGVATLLEGPTVKPVFRTFN